MIWLKGRSRRFTVSANARGAGVWLRLGPLVLRLFRFGWGGRRRRY